MHNGRVCPSILGGALLLVVSAVSAVSVVSASPAREVAKLRANDGSSGDSLGASISRSGDTLVVGTVQEDTRGSMAGAAYVFERDHGGPDSWGQTAKLIAPDGDEDDYFGGAVAIHGDTIAVGAFWGDTTTFMTGAVYLFQRNQGGPGAWGLVKKLTSSPPLSGEFFGYSLALSGDRLLVGAIGATGNDQYAGAVYVFERGQGGPGAWGQTAKLVASDGTAQDQFGNSVALSGDRALIGAYVDDRLGQWTGSAYLFERSAATGAWRQVRRLDAVGVQADDFFGSAVALSGDTALVGALGDSRRGTSAGAAYIFARNQGGADNWGQVARLEASDAAAGDYQGHSVALGGTWAAMGGQSQDGRGAVYLFERDHGGTGAWDEVAKITSADSDAWDFFGSAMSLDGTGFAIAASGDDERAPNAGAAYVLELSTPVRLVFDPIAASRQVGQPFTVRLTARDAGDRLVDFDGTVSLSASLANVSPTTVVLRDGVATVGVTLDNAGATMRLRAFGRGLAGESEPFSVVGGAYSTGSLSGQVLDAGAEGFGFAAALTTLEGAQVHLSDGQTTRVFTTTDGIYRTGAIPCRTYETWASYGGVSTPPVAVDVPCGQHVTREFRLAPGCSVDGPTPVLLVPGVLGSSINTRMIFPRLPKFRPAWDDQAWPGWSTSGQGGLHQAFGTPAWSALVAALRQADSRYRVGCTILPVPYDWRIPIDQIAEDYLTHQIRKAKDQTGAAKVHAHSMGGLVTRAYIQSGDYAGDIDKLAMLGPPNHGAPFAYYVWSGGSPELADLASDDVSEILSFYTTSAHFAYEDISGTPFNKMIPVFNVRMKTFLQEHVSSLRQLLPTFSFLEREGRLHPLVCEENGWLARLNEDPATARLGPADGTDASRVRTRVFRGTGQPTLLSIGVGAPAAPCASRFIFPDGVPRSVSSYTKGDGDGTVPLSSTEIPGGGATYHTPAKSSTHAGLLASYRCEVVQFLTGVLPADCSGGQQAEIAGKAVDGSLALVVTGRVQPYVVDAAGRGTGINPVTGLLEQDIPGSSAVLEPAGANLVIEQPAAGRYTVTLAGPFEEDYGVSAELQGTDVQAAVNAQGMNHLQPATFDLVLGGDPPLLAERSPRPPSAVRAEAYPGPAGPLTRIVWDPSPDPGVTGYRIYSKRTDAPRLAPAGHAIGTSHDTADPFAETPAIAARVYAVAAVGAGGKESFLAGFVVNDDRDGDGLADSAEVERGTPLDDPDADDDGLLDGEEDARGTNPLAADTDDDGFPDAEEAAGGTDPLSPSSTPGISFYTVLPCRLLDTRTGAPLQSGVERLFSAVGACGIPASARALSVNITVVAPTQLGHVTLFPGNRTVPATSTANFTAGQTRANNAILPLATNGQGSLRARAILAGAGQVHLLLDVNGYFQ
jgi:hypothetical protein